ncbi:MAG: phage antirepressor KilAC domain-containing protein [Aeromonadaceae bacterium]
MMNQLIAMNAEMTMSSLDFLNEIINPSRSHAGENEVRPSDFNARVIDEIDEELNYESFVVGKTGHKTHYTMLTMRQMMLVGMRESKSVRRSVLAKLEEINKPHVPQTYAAALLEAGRLAMELEQSQQQLAIAAPKAEFVDRYMAAPETFGFRQVAKKLHMKENELREFLMDNRVMYYLSGRLTAYANHVDAGRFEQVSGVAVNDHAYTQSKFTTKGVEWLAGEIAKSKLK